MTVYCGNVAIISSVVFFICNLSVTSSFQTEFYSRQMPRNLSNSDLSSSSRISFRKDLHLNMNRDPLNDGKRSSLNVVKEFNPLRLSAQEQTEPSSDDGNISVWGARLMLLSVAALWGTNFASVKYLETLCFHPPCDHPPSEAALARFGLAAFASFPFLINQRKDIIMAGLECGALISLGYFTQAIALSYISSGKCAFICSLTVVVVPAIEAVFYGKSIKTLNIVSGILAIAGVGVLEGIVDFSNILMINPALADPNPASIGLVTDTLTSSTYATTDTSLSLTSIDTNNIMQSLSNSKGDIIALGQCFGFGLAFMRIERYVEKFKDVPNRVLTLSAAQCVAVGFLSVLWVLFDFNGSIPNFEYMLEPHRLGAIAWTGIMTTVVAIYIEGLALQKVSATEAALAFASEPVWASLFGAWLLHETLNINSYVGGGIILCACLVSSLGDPEVESVSSTETEI